MNKEAIALYFKDEKNLRTLNIITDLLNQKPVKDIIKDRLVSRATVYLIAKKYDIKMYGYN